MLISSVDLGTYTQTLANLSEKVIKVNNIRTAMGHCPTTSFQG